MASKDKGKEKIQANDGIEKRLVEATQTITVEPVRGVPLDNEVLTGMASLSVKVVKRVNNVGEAAECSITKYSSMDIRQLAGLANNNDVNSQEKIINQFLKIGLSPLIEKLINPFRWERMKEKALEDQRYISFLVNFISKEKGELLEKEIINSVQFHADKGKVIAQFNLGEIYYEEENYQESKRWFKKSAKQGYAPAQYALGSIFYFIAKDIENYQEPKRWFKKAAK